MSACGLVLSDRFMEHETGPHHPERPGRVRAINRRLGEGDVAKEMVEIQPVPVDPEAVERVHARAYIERVREAFAAGRGYVDTPECPVSRHTFEVARLAAGSVVAAVDEVMAGRIRRAFCGVRPPGHHAENRVAMGFCFFNNVAIAAEHLRAKHQVERVAIVDFDVHHGNGTQHHFDRDPNVFFASIHQHPDTLYPGTGYPGETGIGDGAGTTLNVAMAPHTGDDAYRRAFEEQILPALEAYRPGFLLVSAGFDAHEADPLANIELSTDMFGWMTRALRSAADSLCGGRLVSTLEGGYDLRALADSVEQHVAALADN